MAKTEPPMPFGKVATVVGKQTIAVFRAAKIGLDEKSRKPRKKLQSWIADFLIEPVAPSVSPGILETATVFQQLR